MNKQPPVTLSRAIFCALLVSLLPFVSPFGGAQQACCNLTLPTIAQQDGIYATIFPNPPGSFGLIQLGAVQPGFSLQNGSPGYLAWCLDTFHNVAQGGTYFPHIYCSQDPALLDLNVLGSEGIPTATGNPNAPPPWDKINYLLNHKGTASASEIQSAVWAFIGGGSPDPIPWAALGFTDPNPAVVAALVLDANTNGAGFVPGPGQVMGVVLALPPYLNFGNQYQPFIMELPCPPSQCTGAIGDFVWNDLNHDGCQDAGEPGIQGVQVDLYTGCPATTLITSTTTDANGHYFFTGLCGGDYTVHFHTPNGFTHTLANQNCNVGGQPPDSTDSDCTCTGTADCDVCVILPNNTSDLTIDCGYIGSPTPLPCPAGLFLGGKTTGGGTPGDISVAFDQFPAPNDNSYGLNAIGWGGANKHKFSDLTGSDKAGFQILRPNGTVAVSFNVDYITSSTLGSPPSGYKSLGPFGGDGKIVTNSAPTLTSDGTTIQWDTSLARDLNGPQSPFGTYSSPTYFMGGVQTIGSAGTNSASLLTNSPPVDCSLATDPSTCITTFGTPKGSQYPLALPNSWSASYNNPEYAVVPIGSSQFENAIARHVDGWNFHDTYFVTFKSAYLTAIGFDFNNYAIASYDSGTNTFTCPSGKWCVAPNPTVLHNSPAKNCPTAAPGCNLTVTNRAIRDKQVQITIKNNESVNEFITNVRLSWPQGTNGNLTQIKLDGDVMWNGPATGSPINFGVPPLVADQNKRKIDHGTTDVLTFIFQNNVAPLNNAAYSGSATFGCGSVLDLGLPTP